MLIKLFKRFIFSIMKAAQITQYGDASVVIEAEQGIGGLVAGDRVFGAASVMAAGSGAFAEYASVPTGTLARAPAGVSFAMAAALPLAGVSAMRAIETLMLSKGSTIIVQGGSGGIGTFAIQMAKQLGARVIASCRGSAADYVKSLGAVQDAFRAREAGHGKGKIVLQIRE